MSALFKDRLLFAGKYLIGLSLLGWLVWRFDLRTIVRAMEHISAQTLSLVLFLAALNIAIQYRRWRYLIHAHSADFNPGDVIPAFFAGFALRLMIPGGHAEIAKVFLLPGKKSGKVMAFGMEKYFEAYIKLILLLAALPVAFGLPKILFWGIAGAGIVVIYFLPRLLRKRWLKQFQEKDVQYARSFTAMLIYTAGLLLALLLQYYLLLNDHSSVGLGTTVLAVIFVWSSGLLPISIAGMGVRENIAAFYLSRQGIAAPLAAGVAFLVFTLNVLLPAAIGLFFIYRKRHHLQQAGSTVQQSAKKLYRNFRERKK